MEVSYTIVRLLQAFTTIRLPEGETNEPVGSERQRLTLVLSSADGCKVELEKRVDMGELKKITDVEKTVLSHSVE